MISPGAEPLWVITGPTAAGKSALALEVAAAEGAEILSVDSMAVYRRMDIGTAKPSAAERARVPHHLIDLVEPYEAFDTSLYCQAAERALQQVAARGRRPVLVGGTPLYLMALLKGLMRSPAADAGLRAALSAREDDEPGSLHAELASRDPGAAARIHRNDRRRLVRALEVIELTGTPLSAQQTAWARAGYARPCRLVAIARPREELFLRVKERTRAMLAQGLVEEVRAIRDSVGFSRQAAAGIGYRQCLAFLEGRYKDEAELRTVIRRGTHRLIRRQTTWLRRMEGMRWVDASAGPAAVLAVLRGEARA
jgi:tRNA dimethylallyltransferase